MATPGYRHTLVGFSDELDWRVLNFVEPVPSNRICQACGLVSRVTAFLPCLHVFCKKCYDQCCTDDMHCCPFDGKRVSAEDVEWREFPASQLLKRKVKCWNEDRGCDVVLCASELSDHFCKDCDRHSTSCPRCSTDVLCSHICAHILTECGGHQMSAAPVDSQRHSCDQQAMMTALSAIIEARVGEMMERLDQVVNDNNVQIERLNDISHCATTMKEIQQEISTKMNTLQQVASSSEAMHETFSCYGERLRELAAIVSNSSAALKKAVDDTKLSVEQMNTNTESMLRSNLTEVVSGEGGAKKKDFRAELENACSAICSKRAVNIPMIVEEKLCEKETGPFAINIERVMALSTMNVKWCEFLVDGIKSKKQCVQEMGSRSYKHERIYISGYHITPGVHLRKEGECVSVHPAFQLHKGVIDDLLRWPFSESLRMTVRHPSESKEYQKLGSTTQSMKYFARPERESNQACYYLNISFSFDCLEREGYIKDDQLLIIWELVSKIAGN